MACFFGFGSLVNTATHQYEAITPALVNGWARAWINSDSHEHAFLSVIPDPECAIHGLMAGVPNDDWTQLDLREAGYQRRLLHPHEWQPACSAKQASGAAALQSGLLDVQIYQHDSGGFASHGKTILWSYLETVLFGYYQWFGAEGVQAFIGTTRAWVAILDDRGAPQYPRYVPVMGVAADVVNPAIEALHK